eukprot:scaffold178405_cov30-Tisochrysis_lutea.AAC.3
MSEAATPALRGYEEAHGKAILGTELDGVPGEGGECGDLISGEISGKCGEPRCGKGGGGINDPADSGGKGDGWAPGNSPRGICGFSEAIGVTLALPHVGSISIPEGARAISGPPRSCPCDDAQIA